MKRGHGTPSANRFTHILSSRAESISAHDPQAAPRSDGAVSILMFKLQFPYQLSASARTTFQSLSDLGHSVLFHLKYNEICHFCPEGPSHAKAFSGALKSPLQLTGAIILLRCNSFIAKQPRSAAGGAPGCGLIARTTHPYNTETEVKKRQTQNQRHEKSKRIEIPTTATCCWP